jgi:hypothetical protein
MILLVAAVLKTYQLATAPVLGEGLLHARWFNTLVVEFEIFFGFWLITNLLPSLTRLASIFIFSVFTFVSLFKAVTGEKSCGCFGAVTVNPLITSAFDMVIVGWLLMLRHDKVRLCFRHIIDELLAGIQLRKLVLFIVTWLVVAVPVTYTIVSIGNENFGDVGFEFVGINGKKIVTLEPEQWIGKFFPVVEYIDFGTDNTKDELAKGHWLVLFYHDGCEKCAKAIDEYKQFANDFQAGNIETRLALVVVPPITSKQTQPTNEKMIFLSLNDQINWNVKTPVQITLQDGIVKYVDSVFQQ